MSTGPFEVVDADIWVGETAPVGADPDDFWFDTTKVPLFGIDIIGTIPGAGPPVSGVPPVPGTPPDPGDAWWDGDGFLWVWDGDSWENMGNFQGPEGPTGPTGAGGPGPTGPTGATGTGFNILGTLPDAGPPTTPGNPGDAWIGSDGSFWVWDGTGWSPIITGATGGGLPPGGLYNDVLAKATAVDYDAVWVALENHPIIQGMQAEIDALQAALAVIQPAIDAWIITADWSPDGVAGPY